MDERAGGLIPWQWSLYPAGHRNRRNLLLHALTNPLFLAGTCALVASPFAGARFAVEGLLGMAGAVLAQGRGHKLEAASPVPFRGPGDVAARLFVEQWVTFPRYVLSGGFAAAWREGGAPRG
jgi:hypothetical protein